MKKKLFAIVAFGLLGTGVALAQDVIAQRKQAMRAQGQATGPIGRMLQGAEPYDGAKVQAALDAYIATSRNYAQLFPAGSDQGDTRALPAIFQNRDAFAAAVAKFGADATAAKAAIKDDATLKSEMPKVLANCGTCHTAYRRAQ